MEQGPPLWGKAIQRVFYLGPLIFAFGFLAPLTAQLVFATGIGLPAGITPLMVGLVVAAVLGGLAQWRGRWI